jgi:hypothetical protein
MPMKRFTILLTAMACLATPCAADQTAPPPVAAAACPTFAVASKFTSKSIIVDITPVVAGAVYGWTVNAGTIKAGQGTPSLTIDTTGLPKKLDVEVHLIVTGLANCPKGVSMKGVVHRT